MPTTTLCVPIDRATERQLLLEILHRVNRLESAMADLGTAVQDLKNAITALAERIVNQIDPLRGALAAAQQALVDFQAADTEEDAAFEAAIATLTADLEAAVAAGQAAADSIEESVGNVNDLLAETSEEPTPEEHPVEPPAEG